MGREVPSGVSKVKKMAGEAQTMVPQAPSWLKNTTDLLKSKAKGKLGLITVAGLMYLFFKPIYNDVLELKELRAEARRAMIRVKAVEDYVIANGSPDDIMDSKYY